MASSVMTSIIEHVPDTIIPSPVSWHLFAAFIVLVVWVAMRFTGKPADIEPNEQRKFSRLLTSIAVVTVAGFSGCVVYAFRVKDIAGYQPFEEWGWLDSIYGYEAVYTGEWAGFFFLYFFPLLAGLINAFMLPEARRTPFAKRMIRAYPRIIFLSYLCMYAAVTISVTDVKRIQRQVSDQPVEERR